MMKLLKLTALSLFVIAATANTPVTENPPVNDAVQSNCTLPNTAFKAGEKVGFVVYYTAANFINVTAGAGSFTTTLEKLNGKDVYHIKGEGYTLPSYEKFYKAKDTYESYVDVTSLLPLK